MPSTASDENLDIVFLSPVALVSAHGIGGVQQIVERQARWLAARGHRVRVLTTAHPDGLTEFNHDSVAYRFLPVSKVGPLPGVDQFTVDRWRAATVECWPRVLEAGRPDVVHGHAEAELGLIAGGFVGRSTGIGIVSTVYGSPGAGLLDHVRIHGGRRGAHGLVAAGRGALGVLPSFGSGRWLRRSRVIALSNRHARFVRIGYRPRYLHVVAPGLDTVLFHPPVHDVRMALRRRFGIPDDSFVWATVGRAAAGKGLDVACAALTDLARRGADAPEGVHPVRQTGAGDRELPDHLLIAGSGPMSTRISQLAQALGIARRVHLVGDVEPPAAAYMASDAVLFPTAHEESFGLTALEGMACGRAVLATARGAVPEVLGGTGVLIAGRDAGAWSTEMSRLRREPGRRLEMEVAGRRRATACYGRSRTVSALEHVYALAAADATGA